jgi:hypothetical protein
MMEKPIAHSQPDAAAQNKVQSVNAVLRMQAAAERERIHGAANLV